MRLLFRRWKMVSALVLLSPVLGAAVARAQAAPPLEQISSIPFDLASALLAAGGMGPDSPRILVGSAPEWVAKRIVVPKGATLVGSAFQSSAVLSIVNIPLARDSVLDDLKKPLFALGWKMPPVAPRQAFGGFLAAPPTLVTGASTRLTLCDQTQQMTLTLVRRDAKSADIAYRVFTTSGVGGVCNPYQQPPNNFRSPYPALYNPQATVDARSTGDCNAALGASNSTGTTLRTAMAPDALLDHYAKQLTDSGWKGDAEHAAMVSRTFTRPDSAGFPQQLTLTVAAPAKPDGCRDVNMSVKTLRKP
jgi:hypothetical protein